MSRILPILFNTDMVRAILDGRKTVTRRIIKPNILEQGTNWFWNPNENVCYAPLRTGDILYVRETWQCWRAHRYEATADISFKAGGEGVRIDFANGGTDSTNRYDYDQFVSKWFSHDGKWKPSIHMPKETARIWLKVTAVRAERLQDITEEQAKAEGFVDNRGMIHSPDNEYDRIHSAREHFIDIFLKLYPGCTLTTWLWVYEFERCEKPEDA